MCTSYSVQGTPLPVGRRLLLVNATLLLSICPTRGGRNDGSPLMSYYSGSMRGEGSGKSTVFGLIDTEPYGVQTTRVVYFALPRRPSEDLTRSAIARPARTGWLMLGRGEIQADRSSDASEKSGRMEEGQTLAGTGTGTGTGTIRANWGMCCSLEPRRRACRPQDVAPGFLPP